MVNLTGDLPLAPLAVTTPAARPSGLGPEAWLVGLALVGGLTGLGQPALAQNLITPDASLGAEASVVTPFGPLDLITGGAQRGDNLFHSFGEFNIDSGYGAAFITPIGDVASIFARVTGLNPSQILGVLGTRQGNLTTPSTADLFLINPNGMVFGPGASLDMAGSFYATTADSIQFGDEGQFSALDPTTDNLLTINPSALWFSGLRPPAPITIQGDPAIPIDLRIPIQVAPGAGLSLIGGPVLIDAKRILAPGGRVDILALDEGGTIDLGSTGVVVPGNRPRSDITLRNQAVIDTIADGGGDITLYGRDLSLDQGSTIATGIGLGLGSPSSQGGNIRIDSTGTVTVANSSVLGNTLLGLGEGGDIDIKAATIALVNGGLIGAAGIGQGKAGDVRLTATESITLRGRGLTNLPSGITSSMAGNVPGFENLPPGRGDGGNIILDASEISLADGALVFSSNVQSIGNAGNVRVIADRLTLRDGSQLNSTTFGTGNAGNIVVQAADQIVLTNGSQLTSSTSGSGNGGAIDVYGENRIVLEGRDAAGSQAVITTSVFPTTVTTIGPRQAGSISLRTGDQGSLDLNDASMFSNVEAGAIGRGGDITVDASRVRLTNGGQIQSILRDSSGTLPGAQGQTGNIVINARDNFIAVGRGSFGLPSGLLTVVGVGAQGPGGDIKVDAGSVFLQDGGTLNANTFGVGDAGDILVLAREVVDIREGDPGSNAFTAGIFTQVSFGATGNGGDIKIRAQSLSMSGLQSALQSRTNISTATSGIGNAGHITLTIDQDISLLGKSYIFSNVFGAGQGNAGNIGITGQSLSLRQGSEIAASVFRAEEGLPGGQGRGGNVGIKTTDFVDIEGIGPTGFRSGIFVNTQRGASGPAGNVEIRTGRFRIADGAVVTSQTLNPSNSGDITIVADSFRAESGGQIVADTQSSGNAGTITLTISGDSVITGVDPNYESRRTTFPNAPVANVSDRSGIFATTAADTSGIGGTIVFRTGSLNITDGGQIGAGSLGTGLAGNIEITTNGSGQFNRGGPPITYSLLMENGDITTQAQSSSGGNILINTIGSAPIVLLGDSDIITNSLGNGGNITLNGVIVALDDSDILARSEDARGGNINLGPFFSQTLPLGAILPTENNRRVDVSADGELASGVITTPDTSVIENSLATLQDAVIDPDSLTASSCIARQDDSLGSFLVTGGGGLPHRPGDPTISAYPTGTVRTTLEPAALQEPDGVYQLADGRLVLSHTCR